MGTKEYVFVVLSILVPLVIATVVTLWTLEQARLRSKKNRGSSRPKADSGPPPSEPV